MKKMTCILFLLPLCCIAIAQKDDNTPEPGEASKAYHNTRLKDSRPPFGLAKIKAIISALKGGGTGMDGEIVAPDQQTYFVLSLREKFTYHMIHPESYSQNCDGMPPVADEEKQIFGQLPEGYAENAWSERQKKFFLANRDSVIALMQYCINADKNIGLNFKHVIVDVHATQLIPLIIETYNITKKDHDLLTVLLLLMKDGEYRPFITSSSYKKLYATGDDTYFSKHLTFNSENEALIIKRATDFYNSLSK